MRDKFYRFLSVEADFFAAILFWGGLAICAVDLVRTVLAWGVFLLGGPLKSGDGEALIGVALLAVSFLLHKTKEVGS